MFDEMDKFLIAFATVPGIGPARTKLLIDYFGDAQKAWEAPSAELAKTGLSQNVLHELLEQRQKLNFSQYLSNLDKRGIKWLTINNPDYPQSLTNIPDPPLILFIRSNLNTTEFQSLIEGKIIGVVGTRKMTSYGQEVTQNLVSGLVAAGFVIVSGMALGIDGVAHGTAINCGGKTIAVLGAGVDVIYPSSHRDLYNHILESGGAIVSEVAPEKTVSKGIFPARNRIISGLSQAVLVTEGALDSGSLITARLAIDQGREVFAVPGPINSAMAQGTNYLLKNGAKLVTSVEDILEGLGYDTNKASKTSNSVTKIKGGTPEEQVILDLLYIEPRDFDELVRLTGINAGSLGGIIGKMEIEVHVINKSGMYKLP